MVSILNTSGIEVGLIVCTDTYSHHLEKTDRSNSLFDDGATSTIISLNKSGF